MDEIRFKQRAVIEFLTLEGVIPLQIHERLVTVYGGEALSKTQVYFWIGEIKRGRKSLQDEARSGRHPDAVCDENVRAVEKLVMNNRRMKIWEIRAETGLSYGTISRILHDHLKLSKVSARWVPRNLSVFDKQRRVECASENLALINKGKKNFFSRLVTCDETWLRCWDPESKQESMQWKHADSPPPKKFRSQASAKKVMATIFFDCEEILLVDYLPPKTTITGPYYANLIKKLRAAIKEKRRGKLAAGVLLLQDNAAVHQAAVSMAAIRESGFQLLNHAPYSPDLSPCDYFLFPNLKRDLRGNKYEDIPEVISAAEAHFQRQGKEYFLNGLKCLEKRFEKCISIGGSYVEK